MASDSGLPSRLFATASFAWAFYFVNMTIGRLRVHRRWHIKIVLVPSMAITFATYLGGRWIIVGTMAAAWWALISVVVWEADHRARQQAERDFVAFIDRRAAGQARGTQEAGSGGFLLPPEGAEPDRVYPAPNCCICLEEFPADDQDAGASDDRRPYTLPCGHQGFHRECLQTWLDSSRHKRCPACRETIDWTTSWVQTVF